MRTRFSFILALFLVLGFGGSALAANSGDGSFLVRSVVTRKQAKLIARQFTIDGSLPAPGGSISWNVYSQLDLYTNVFGDRGAVCNDGANTGQSVYKLYLRLGQLKVNRVEWTKVDNYNKAATNTSSYRWVSQQKMVRGTGTEWTCVGEDHSGQATSSSPISTLDTSATSVY